MRENYDNIPEGLLDKLHETTDFHEYTKLLREAARFTAVAVVSNDTPTGPDFTEADAKAVNDIGFNFDFSNSFRKSLAGLVYKGKLVLSEITPDFIARTIKFGDAAVLMWSNNYYVSEKESAVGIGEVGIKAPRIGLTFYVLSIPEKKIIDAASFDTQEKDKRKNQLTAIVKFIQDYSDNHTELTVIGIAFPVLETVPADVRTENEQFIEENDIRFGKSEEKSILKKLFSDTEDFKAVVTAPPSYADMFGVRKFYDFGSKLVNCKNGIRVTPNAPDTYKRAIYIVGNCLMFGVGSGDNGTIAAYLQSRLNDECPEYGFRVFNYGFLVHNAEDEGVSEVGRMLEFLPTKPGDIVITGYEYGMKEPISYKDIQRPYKYGDIFFDKCHFTEAGNHVFADQIFERIKANNFYSETVGIKPEIAKTPRRDKLNLTPEEMEKLSQYIAVLDNIAALLEIKPDDNIGAIVMNCNPFTNGHRYLIETAAAQVKYLIVFVVEEDKSEFPFAERYELVQAATDDLENVFAVPSGNFIISSLTFSEYFNKKDIASMSVNPSNDVRMFGGQLAPHLFIKVRFAGEEPLDPVTRRYNREMEAILPEYGFKFTEIPRKETEGNVISASRVRELLKTRDYEAIAKLVPEVTLEYLKNMYKL